MRGGNRGSFFAYFFVVVGERAFRLSEVRANRQNSGYIFAYRVWDATCVCSLEGKL